MTLKVEHLKSILEEINRMGYTNEVPENTLDQVIMKQRGMSSYVVSNVKRALVKMNLMKPAAIGFWKFCNVTKELDAELEAIDNYNETAAEHRQAEFIAEAKQELN